ncbi:SCY1-like protein 2 [Aplysia californica]|uniref:SCY1-like protein 2 n=1 Tax=Aplysia californica TaxID=6500 RepID=A0ABM1VT18_APLCA|nr:SCY1-like protein 2 [Aplysia californica]
MDVLHRLKSAVTNVLPGNPLSRDFDIQAQVASAGPRLLWKVFSAVKKSTKEEASVFLFEKKSLERFQKRDREVIVDGLRRGVQQLTKLRHPRILSVIQPLEETREALAFATEPVFASLANVLGSLDNIGSPPQFLTDFELYEVEIKHGLLQVLEGLWFLHQDAKMLHRNVCPTSVLLAKTGTWKLAGCEFVLQASDTQEQNPVYRFEEWRSDVPPEAQPNLDYLAPECELTQRVSPSSDMFSFGVLMYALFNKGRTLYQSHGELTTHRRNLQELSGLRSSQLSNIPPGLVDHVKLLLNTEPTLRPDAAQMTKVPFFEDMACVALQYIDSLYQRENMEKANFFKGLPKVIDRLPKVGPQQRILPALFKEGINANMVPFVLPSVFLIAEQSSTEEYRALILPGIIPFLKLREPIQVILMFLQNMNLLLSKTPTQQLQTYVFPLIFSALESDSPQIQELCLNIIPTFADLIEYNTLKKSLVPRVKKLCLSTSVLNVRVNSLLCIGKLMDQMDKWYVLDEVLPFLRDIPTREPAVLMSILGIHKVALSEAKLGITKDVMANKVLPFLIPLSIDNNLNLSQFNAYMSVIKEMLSKVDAEHRGKLEQLDQMQQDHNGMVCLHRTLEISKITGENGSAKQQTDGKSSFMDKFLTGVGLGGSVNQTSATSPVGGASSPDSTPRPAHTTANATVTKESSLTPKKTGLTLEEKQRLAKQQEQERTLKSQRPLQPLNSSTTSPAAPVNGSLSSSSFSSSKSSSSSSSSSSARNGPRDLTSTLMESNMRNLSVASKSSPAPGATSCSPSTTPLGMMVSSGFSGGMAGGRTGGGGPVNWQGGGGVGGGGGAIPLMNSSSSVNWGSSPSPSSSHSSPFAPPMSSMPSSSSSLSSGQGKSQIDMSSFDSLLTTPGVGANRTPPMNQMGGPGGLGVTGGQPARQMTGTVDDADVFPCWTV